MTVGVPSPTLEFKAVTKTGVMNGTVTGGAQSDTAPSIRVASGGLASLVSGASAIGGMSSEHTPAIHVCSAGQTLPAPHGTPVAGAGE